MENKQLEFARKLSIKFEDHRGLQTKKLAQIKLSPLDSYKLYTVRPNDIRIIEHLKEFMILTETDEHNDIIMETIPYLMGMTGAKFLHALKWYIIGLNERGIKASVHTSNMSFFVDEEFEENYVAWTSTSSENAFTETYPVRSMNSRVYEVIADNQGTLTELRIGDFSALYCTRKFYKKFFPERVSEMYIAGKTVEIFDIQDWGLPRVSSHTHQRRPRVSSAFRELLDDSFDYEFLDVMEESAKKFSLNGLQLDGHFFYDYRGRMYWSGNINPQGEQENRHLNIDGKDIIEYDATCSGVQLGSLLSGNVPMMKRTNVISTGTKDKQDAYQYIADKACEEMGLPIGTIPRNIAKKPVMLLPYGAASRTMLGHAIEASRETYSDEDLERIGLTHEEIGKGVYRAVEHHIARETTYKKILDLIEVKVFSKNGVDYGQYCSWTTPDGLNVNSYSKLDASKINQMLADGANLLHTYNKATLNIELGGDDYHAEVFYVNGCNIKFYKGDTPNVGQLVPNFIHSLDATALRFVCKKLLSEGHDVFPIHDCVIVSEEVSQDHISNLFQQAYQFIADYYGCDVKVDGMIVFPE